MLLALEVISLPFSVLSRRLFLKKSVQDKKPESKKWSKNSTRWNWLRTQTEWIPQIKTEFGLFARGKLSRIHPHQSFWVVKIRFNPSATPRGFFMPSENFSRPFYTKTFLEKRPLWKGIWKETAKPRLSGVQQKPLCNSKTADSDESRNRHAKMLRPKTLCPVKSHYSKMCTIYCS